MLGWLVVGGLLPAVRSFSFSAGAPSECDALSLRWTGGSSPFSVLVAPLFGVPRNISVPPDAYVGGQGSFSFPLPIAASHRFVLTMSDGTGFGTGGSTPILTTGPSRGSSACNLTEPGVAFNFELNSALQQCRPYIVNGYDGAIQPVTIVGTVPGGTSFVLTPPIGSTTFSWNANVAAGTSLVFSMFDSTGRSGGTADIKTVGITDDATCLNNQSPSSTASSPPSHTPPPNPSSPSPSSPSSSSTPDSGSHTSIALIAGTVIGALIFMAVLITLGLFFLRKRHDSHRHVNGQSELDLTYSPRPPNNSYPYPSGSAAASTVSPLNYMPPSAYNSSYNSNPFTDAYSPYTSTAHLPPDSSHQPSPLLHAQSPSFSHGDSDPFNPYEFHGPPLPGAVRPFNIHTSEDSGSMTSTQRKAAMAGISSYTPSRFIIHTDVEDELPPPNNDGVVELPPQYTERRGQPPAISQNVPSHSSASPLLPPH